MSLRAQMTEKISSEHGKKRMRDRACLIEHVFGEIKETFRFRRFMHRGPLTMDGTSVLAIVVPIGEYYQAHGHWWSLPAQVNQEQSKHSG
jgi:hypothetical protein